jgi:hypothetical protein
MVDIGMLAISLAVLMALSSGSSRGDLGYGLVALVVAAILTSAADRAVFGSKRKAFWRGASITGCLVAVLAFAWLQETREFLLAHGPPIVRVRRDLQMRHAMAAQSRAQGIEVVPPRVPEERLALSFFAELTLGLLLGSLIAALGGLFAWGIMSVARRISEGRTRRGRLLESTSRRAQI